jgi:H+/Cl- antiporter ClcA
VSQHDRRHDPYIYDREGLSARLKRSESLSLDVFLAFVGAGGGLLVFVLCAAAVLFNSAGQDTLTAAIVAFVVAASGLLSLWFRFGPSHGAGLKPWQSTLYSLATVTLFCILLPVLILFVFFMFASTGEGPNRRL